MWIQHVCFGERLMLPFVEKCLLLCVFCAGVSALLTVALEGVRDPAQLQMVEFGRGFGYKLPLSIGMPSVGSALLKQIVSQSCHLRQKQNW